VAIPYGNTSYFVALGSSHDHYVCGITLWQQEVRRGNQKLQHSHFGGDKQVRQRIKFLWQEVVATI
jgi:hypothetical protein